MAINLLSRARESSPASSDRHAELWENAQDGTDDPPGFNGQGAASSLRRLSRPDGTAPSGGLDKNGPDVGREQGDSRLNKWDGPNATRFRSVRFSANPSRWPS